MNSRHAAALALVGWYLMVVPTTTNAQGPATSTPSRKAAHVGPAVSHAQADAAIAANARVLKVPHVKYMAPELVIDKNAVSPTPFWVIGVFVDKSENVREVGGKVPSQLDGVRVLVGAAPVVVWCLSVRLGKNIDKECSECLSVRSGKEASKDCSRWCAMTLELEAHSCEKEFKTKAQCESGVTKYVQDWYADADKSGEVVALAPTAECWELTNPTKSHRDLITQKAVPDRQ